LYFLEPGYYEEDFGIRLEDIVLVKDATTDYKMPQKQFLQLETVTMCPIQTKMLTIELLTDKEVKNTIFQQLSTMLYSNHCF